MRIHLRSLVAPLVAAGLVVSACKGGELLYQAVTVTLQKVAGDGQTGLATYAVNTPPAVKVTDTRGHPVPNVPVTFAVTSGGGSVTGGTATTGSDGIATVGSWAVQLGANTLSATSDRSASTVSFAATGVAAAYHIDVRLLSAITPTQQAAFDSAVAKWERLIYGDMTDIPATGPDTIPAGTCGSNSPKINEVIDDIIIFATLDSIDGPGGILGQAGPCYVRLPPPNPGWQPVVGLMHFDTADVANLETAGLFDEVILHEMGHVLGYGTVWGSCCLNLLVDPAALGGTDPHFVGTQAIAAFNQIGGTGYTAGAKVPVENTGGAGTRDAHWRESVFGTELMTGFLNGGVPNPLSVVSVASMADEGYQVNYAGADAFSLSFAAAALRAGAAPGIQLKDDILKLPIRIVNRQGQVMRVVMPQ